MATWSCNTSKNIPVLPQAWRCFSFKLSEASDVFMYLFFNRTLNVLIIKNLKTVCPLHTLCPESSENIPILLQEANPYFSNQNDLRNPKMGSKQSVVVPPTTDFFKKLFFGKKKCQKIGRFVVFWILMAIHVDKLDQFKKI